MKNRTFVTNAEEEQGAINCSSPLFHVFGLLVITVSVFLPVDQSGHDHVSERLSKNSEERMYGGSNENWRGVDDGSETVDVRGCSPALSTLILPSESFSSIDDVIFFEETNRDKALGASDREDLLRKAIEEIPFELMKGISEGEYDLFGVHHGLFTELIKKGVSLDFDLTFDFVENLQLSRMRSAARLALVQSWSQLDFEGSLAFVSLIADTNEQMVLYNAAAKSLVESNRSQAESLVDSAEAGLRKELLLALGRNYADEDPLKALEFSLDLSSDLQEAVVEYAAKGLVEGAPSVAIEYLESNPNSMFSDEIMRKISTVLSKKNPVQAADWFLKRDNEDGREQYIGSNVAMGMLRFDQDRGVGFINDLQPSVYRDGVIRNALNNRLVKDPEESFYLSVSVGSQSMRKSLIRSSFKRWYELDSASATEALRTSGVPVASVEDIMNR